MRNFFHILKIYPKDSLLNIFCLSIAFSIFYILLSHILWEWTFDGFHKDAASIYQVKIENDKKSRSDILNYTESERILKHSPHIVAGGIYFNQTERRVNVKINKKDADQTEVSMVWVSPDFPNVFTFDMHEGSTNCLKDPGQVIMPLSIDLIPVRIKSINTMKIFGATTARLRISLLLETVILLGISCFLSSVWIELFSNTSLNDYLNASISLPENQGMAAFTLLVALFAGFSIGLYPAFI